MLNGNVLMEDDPLVTQRVIIIQKPESDNLYYVFFVGRGTWTSSGRYGLWYDIVNINGDNGLGEVIEKNKLIESAWDAQEKLFAVKHVNNKDIWVITRKMKEDKFASYLLTKNGLDLTPVLSNALQIRGDNAKGYMKISYNKKYIFAAYLDIPPYTVEIGSFNSKTGVINLLYYSLLQTDLQGRPLRPFGIDFSPDSKLLYVAYASQDNDVDIFQYEMKFLNNHVQFAQSAERVGKGAGIGLQLARDGKIYCSYPLSGQDYYYVSTINKPWMKGISCNYQKDDIYLNGSRVYYCFPNILLDYLYRFEWEGECSGPSNAIRFKPNFMFPDSIHWNFNDPASGADSISNELSPVHYFTSGGEFEVSADVWYPPDSANPFGRYEHTSRVVTVKQSPLPDLGNDTLICKDASIELDGGAGEGSYVWNTGDFGMNDSLITVSDTGTYWVKVNAPNGCVTVDSVQVEWQPPALFLEDSLVITPTSCGGNSGSITGLQVQGTQPLTFTWLDADGNVLSNNLDISGLGVGNYYLQVTDGNGCVTLSESYTVTDAGDITVDTVLVSGAHCGQNNGSITVFAHSEATSFFNYSVDDGNFWQENDSVFKDLISGNYIIRVSDINGCQSVYNYNPVVVDNVPPPLVTSVTVTDETNHDGNGGIVISATGSGSLSFSINSGSSFQDNGSFSNLSAGVYPCMVQDTFGCDTSFEVTVNRLSTQVLEAMAGDGHTCLGKAALVPLMVSGFDSVTGFRTEVTYDSSVLTVTGYQNADPSIQGNLSVQTVQNDNRVIALWQDNNAVTLADNTTLFQLIFEGKKEGYSSVDWAHSAGESSFVNAAGEVINTEFVTGNVRIFSTPQILLADQQKICENDNLFISPFVSGGSGAYSYSWQGPGGFTSDNSLLWINNVQQSMEGSYSFTVTDTINCVEQKTVQVMVDPAPLVSFASKDTLFMNPGDLLEAGTDAIAYLWSTGDTTAAIKLDSMGSYWLSATGINGCKSFDTVQVLWGGMPFFVPNAFTPNGDGLNDVFKVIPRYDYVRNFVLQVYNRWGGLIFEGEGSNSGWDGTFKGQPVARGTYIYRIAYRDFQTNQSQVVQGTVVVVR